MLGVLGRQFNFMFANSSRHFLSLQSVKISLLSVFVDLALQRESLLGPFSQIVRCCIEKIEKIARIGVAGGRGKACQTMQILHRMVRNSTYALFPLGVRRILRASSVTNESGFGSLGVLISIQVSVRKAEHMGISASMLKSSQHGVPKSFSNRQGPHGSFLLLKGLPGSPPSAKMVPQATEMEATAHANDGFGQLQLPKRGRRQ